MPTGVEVIHAFALECCRRGISDRGARISRRFLYTGTESGGVSAERSVRPGLAQPALAIDPIRQGLGSTVMARTIWRHRLDRHAALSLRYRMLAARHSDPAGHGLANVWSGAYSLRHCRAKGLLPAENPLGRALLVPGILRTGRRLRSGLAPMPCGARGHGLCDQRNENMDHPCALGELDLSARPYGVAGQAAGRHLLSARADEQHGNNDSTDPQHVGRARDQSDFLR